jgi:aspartate dehydrogenase
MEDRVMRVGIVGVGIIGQALAKAIDRGEVAVQLTALHSRNLEKARAFADTLCRVPEVVEDIAGVIARCDLVIEAATQTALSAMASDILGAGKDLMVLSVGALLDHPEWPALAARHGCRLYVPSGAIVGLDGLKGACVGQVDSVTITTRKPPQGLAGRRTSRHTASTSTRLLQKP